MLGSVGSPCWIWIHPEDHTHPSNLNKLYHFCASRETTPDVSSRRQVAQWTPNDSNLCCSCCFTGFPYNRIHSPIRGRQTCFSARMFHPLAFILFQRLPCIHSGQACCPDSGFSTGCALFGRRHGPRPDTALAVPLVEQQIVIFMSNVEHPFLGGFQWTLKDTTLFHGSLI